MKGKERQLNDSKDVETQRLQALISKHQSDLCSAREEYEMKLNTQEKQVLT